MSAVLQLHFDRIQHPVSLVNCSHLSECLPKVFPGWMPQISGQGDDSALIVLSYQKPYYRLTAPWLDEPVQRKDRVDALCSLVAELMRAYVQDNQNRLCLHAAAAKFANQLVVFPSKYRAGKSLLSACLAANDVQIFCDDVLPIELNTGEAIAPGIAPRLRLPLPDQLGAESRAFIDSNISVEGKQYRYLDLGKELLAPRGSAAPIGAFVLLEREAGATAVLEPVEQADVLHQVVWQNFAREADAAQILQRLDQVVAHAQRYRLRYDQADDAVELLCDTFVSWPEQNLENYESKQTFHRVDEPLASMPAGSYCRLKNIAAVEIDGNSFLADHEGEAIHHLNPVGSAIWNLLAEPTMLGEMIELLSAAFPHVARDQLSADVSQLIDELLSKQLIVEG